MHPPALGEVPGEGLRVPLPARTTTEEDDVSTLTSTAAAEGIDEIAGHKGHTLLLEQMALGRRLARCECGADL